MDRLKSQNSQSESAPDQPSSGSISASQVSPGVEPWVSSVQQAQPGDKIGKYEVINEIGRGGMSIVYKARDQDLNRLVAVKLMLKSANESLNLLRFQKEARAASQLEHPNVVKVHDFSTTPDGTPYLVMSYLDGVSLADAIKNEGSFSLGRWLSVMIQACDALEHAHLAGVVHRDIKPSNFVLAQENGTEVLKLVDFGIATNSFDDMSLTKTGEIFGSPLYMSPEQCSGAKLDSRSDIYSLGCVMYEALAGKPPLSGTNSLSTLQKHLTDKPISLSKLKLKTKNIQQLDRIVMRCLEKDPENRYQNLADLKKELELLFQGGTGDAPTAYAINAPIVVACTLVCLGIFLALLNFDKLAESLHFSEIKKDGKAASEEVSKVSNSAPTKLDELRKCDAEYQNLIKQGDYRSALVLANRVTKLAEELHLPALDRGKGYIEQGYCEGELKHPVAAAGCFEQALSLIGNPKTSIGLKVKLNALLHYGQIQRQMGLTDKAQSSFQQALNAGVQLNNNHLQALSLMGIGNCERDRQNFAQCLVRWNQALKLDPSNKKVRDNIEEVENR